MPSRAATVTPLYDSPSTAAFRRTNVAAEGMWRVSEALGSVTDTPAALELATRKAGELTEAGAAAIFLTSGREQVLASRWGAVTLPVGTRRADLRAALEHGFTRAATEPIRAGTREIGGLWIGRAAEAPFQRAERVIQQKLAAMISLVVTTLHERTRGERTAIGAGARAVSGQTASSHNRQAALDAALRTTLPTVPLFPPTLARLLAALDDAANEPEEIEAILRLDPLLTARVIRAASSVSHGRARPVAGIPEAMLVLGVRGIRQIAIAQFARSLASQDGPIARMLWEQSVGTAVRAEAALAVGRPAASDAAYLSGLFHNVGTIVLENAHHVEYERAIQRGIVEDRPIVDCERAEFGTDGVAITAELLDRWQIPSRLLCVLQAPHESLMARALDWAQHAALAANPEWRALRTALGAGGEAAWLATRVQRATRDLTVAALDPVAIEERSVARVETTHQLLHA